MEESLRCAFANVKRIAGEAGFTHTIFLDCATIELLEEVRDMCQANTCGQYQKNWACPPACGDLNECRERLKGYRWGILVQTVGELQDSLDVDAMRELEEKHKEQFLMMAKELRQVYEEVLPLGTGACTLCAPCTCPEKACRLPEQRISSMEAYGILVSELCKRNGMKYYYGPNTMAYTSCCLIG